MHKDQSRSDSRLFAALAGSLLRSGIAVRFEAQGFSMTPTIRNGDALYVDPVQPENIQRGNIVLLEGPRGITAHRVAAVNSTTGEIITRGDASDTSDAPVLTEKIFGSVKASERRGDHSSLRYLNTHWHTLRAACYRRARRIRNGLQLTPIPALRIALLFVLGAGMPAHAAVAVDSTTSSNAVFANGVNVDSSTSLGQHVTTAANTITFNHTTSGPNTLLIVGVSINLQPNTGLTVGTITYNGVGLTLINTAVNGATRRVELWSLKAPAAGTHSIVVTMAGTTVTATGVVVGATTFNNVNQAAPTGAFVSANGVNNNPTVAVASGTGQMVIDVTAAGGNRTIAGSAAETTQWNLNSTAAVAATDVRGFGSTLAGAATVTPNQTLSGNSNWVIAAVPINPIAAGTATLVFNHTTAGANTFLIVGVSINLTNNAALTVSSVTYNGVALTSIGSKNDASNTRRIEMWRLIAPATGANSVVVTIGGLTATGTNFGVVAGAITFTGVDQNTPLGTFASASDSTGADANPRVRVTSNPGELVLDTMAAGGNQTATGQTSVQTAQWSLVSSAGASAAIDVVGYGSTAAGAANVTMAESLSGGSNWAIGAISIKPVTADLSITKSIAPNPPSSGANATYTLTVTNNGPSGATGVTVTDPLPANVTFVSATPSQGACVGTTTQTCALGALANAGTATITIVVTVNSLSGLNNVATVTANESDSNPANNTAVNVVSAQTPSCAVVAAPPAGGTLTGPTPINTYFSGPANTTLAAGAKTVTLGAGTGAATAVSIGDVLLIIQMQDAAINFTNTDSYGDGVAGPPAAGSTSLNNAGIYEYITATNNVVIGGGALNFTGTGAGGGLLYNYTNANATAAQGQRQFQVIRVPQFSTATLSSTLTAKRWGCTYVGATPTCTGGVLALDVAQTLTLGGTVDLSGFGFQGGGGVLLTGGVAGALSTDFEFNAPTAPPAGSDGSKAEGIAGTPKYTFNQVSGALNTLGPEGYPGGSFARGAPGNAGGGATDADAATINDENAGGGGGGNGGAGGNGGDSWNAGLASGGFGGAAFPANQLRVVMGGGGGAGDTNNGTSDPNTNVTGINSSGAAGGGIIIIRASAVAGTGTLQANGASALNVMNDGGGGGGAGGSIVVLSTLGSLANLTVNAQGGNGGGTWHTNGPGTPYPGNLHGPGGGGGGGVIILTSAPLASSVAGGADGTSTTSADPFGSSSGSNGLLFTNASSTLSSGQNSGAACTDLSITKTSAPNPVITGNNLTYTLKVTNNWFSTATSVTVTDPLPASVTFVSATPSQGACAQAAGTVTCNLGSINAAATATITIVVTAGAPNTVSNTATVGGNQTDNSPNDETSTDNNTIVFPTAVKLESLHGMRLPGGGVEVQWRTSGEVHNLGFNLYREQDGQRVRVNPSLIAGSALLLRDSLPQHTAKTYAWIDSMPGQAVSYWLEDMELNGTRTWHGPVSVETEAQQPESVRRAAMMTEIARDSGKPVSSEMESHPLSVIPRLPLPSSRQREVQFWLAAQPAIKVSVSHNGLYRIPQSALLTAGLNANADARNLHLYAEGVEQPLRIVGGESGVLDVNDAIEFYGTGIDTNFSATRVYWLVVDNRPGLRIPVLPVRSSEADMPQSFPYTIERKDRTTYFAALLNGDASNFFGAVVTSTPTDQGLTVTNMDQASSENLPLEVSLQGVTDNTSHVVSVQVNGASIGTIAFDGQTRGSAIFDLPHNLVADGQNTVTLTSEGGDNDVSLVDTIRLTYRHTYTAESNSLTFTAPSGVNVFVQGFTSQRIQVLDITNPSRPLEIEPRVISKSGNVTAAIHLPVFPSGTRTLLAVADEALGAPDALVQNHPSTWHNAQPGSQIVMITHPDFADAISPLRTLHQSQGISVAVAGIDELYDEFSFGEKNPAVIREFLQLTQRRWQVAPRYVLLAGRASFDPRNYLGFGDLDFVPTKLIDTAELETASDDWFSDFNNTSFAQITTGRLPVSTPAEATLLVNKIVNYAQNQTSETWDSQALLVADVNTGFDFTAETATVQKLLPRSLTVSSVLANNLDPGTARAQLLAYLNSGSLLVNYLGHGSVEVWSGDSLLTSDDALALTNGSHLPVVLTLDCLNGFFHDVFTHSIATSLLLAPNGGAVAVWASSGLTQPAPQAVMDEAFISLLLQNTSITVGDAARLAKTNVTDPDVRRTWIFFGDPALRLKGQMLLPARTLGGKP